MTEPKQDEQCTLFLSGSFTPDGTWPSVRCERRATHAILSGSFKGMKVCDECLVPLRLLHDDTGAADAQPLQGTKRKTMDPEKTWASLMQVAHEVDDKNEATEDHCLDLANGLLDLEEWLDKGGFFPPQWRVADHEVRARLEHCKKQIKMLLRRSGANGITIPKETLERMLSELEPTD